DRIRLVALGLGLMTVSMLLIPVVPRTLVALGPVDLAPWVLAAILVAGVGESFAMPAQQAVFVTLGRVVGMGSLMGLNNMGMSSGFLFGSLVGAAVVASLGISAVFVFAGLLMAAGIVLYVAIMRG